jgi:hypothetical protein
LGGADVGVLKSLVERGFLGKLVVITFPTPWAKTFKSSFRGLGENNFFKLGRGRKYLGGGRQSYLLWWWGENDHDITTKHQLEL